MSLEQGVHGQVPPHARPQVHLHRPQQLLRAHRPVALLLLQVRHHVKQLVRVRPVPPPPAATADATAVRPGFACGFG